MSIINRNFLINKSKKDRNKGGAKQKGRAKTYYSISCPKCGDPKAFGTLSLNRFGSLLIGKKVKCILCNSLLHEGCLIG